MKKFLQVIGSIFLWAMVPVSILWVWHPDHWLQFMITDMILFVGGFLTLSIALSSVKVVPKDPKDPIIWTN